MKTTREKLITGFRRKRAAALCLAIAFTSSCSSHKTAKSEFGPSYKDRMSNFEHMLKKSDFTQRSSFEKQMAGSDVTKKFTGGSGFAAKESQFSKKEVSTKSFKTKDYTGTNKISSDAEKSYHAGKDQNSMAKESFQTKESAFGKGKDRDAGKSFNGGDKSFATRESRYGAKKVNTDKKPAMANLDKPSYTEGEVQNMLNK